MSALQTPSGDLRIEDRTDHGITDLTVPASLFQLLEETQISALSGMFYPRDTLPESRGQIIV